MIQDFQCTYDNSAGINESVTKGLNLSFPEAYCQADSMVQLALALKQHDGACFCELPFCHTLEAEAMGGHIQYGDAQFGPRAKDYVCTSLSDVLSLPDIDFSKGRIRETLTACEKLSKQGEHVVFELSGPFTVLNVLLDARIVFKGLRKEPETMAQVFEKLSRELIRFAGEAKKAGATFLSVADSAGGVNILGPKLAEKVVQEVTYPTLQALAPLADENTLLLLCPKTTFALLGTNLAHWQDHPLEEPLPYGEACLKMVGQATFAGQMCIKNTHFCLKDKQFKEVVLNPLEDFQSSF